MTKNKLVLVGIAAGAVSLCFGGILYVHGMFQKIRWRRKKVGPFFYIYRDHLGPYHTVGKAFQEFRHQLQEIGIGGTPFSLTAAGCYLDEPGSKPEPELRSRAGYLLPSADEFEEIPEGLVASPPYYKLVIDEDEALVAEFPLVSRFSYMLAPMKVYPTLGTYMKEHDIECKADENENEFAMEIYHDTDKHIEFVMGLKHEN